MKGVVNRLRNSAVLGMIRDWAQSSKSYRILCHHLSARLLSNSLSRVVRAWVEGLMEYRRALRGNAVVLRVAARLSAGRVRAEFRTWLANMRVSKSLERVALGSSRPGTGIHDAFMLSDSTKTRINQLSEALTLVYLNLKPSVLTLTLI